MEALAVGGVDGGGAVVVPPAGLVGVGADGVMVDDFAGRQEVGAGPFFDEREAIAVIIDVGGEIVGEGGVDDGVEALVGLFEVGQLDTDRGFLARQIDQLHPHRRSLVPGGGLVSSVQRIEEAGEVLAVVWRG